MKKNLVFLFCVLSLFSFAQPKTPRSSKALTVEDQRLIAALNFVMPRYTDTAQANLNKGLDSCGALVFIRSTGDIYKRLCSPKSWVKIATGGGGSGGVSSVGLTMPSAFTVSGSPVTDAGNLTVAANGTISQYIRGNGTLATLPTIPSQISYFTNDAGYITNSSLGPYLTTSAANSTFQPVGNYLTNITGKISPGSNVTIGGLGTTGSPYVINATGSTTTTGTNFPWYNIDDYIVGDGVTNDGPAIQTLLDSATKGRAILIGHKPIFTTTQINVAKNFSFIGEGPDNISSTGGASVFKTNSPTLTMFKVTAPGVIFEKISFLNTATTPTAGTAILFDNNTGDYHLNPNSAKLIDISVDGFFDDISFKNCSNWEMARPLLKNPVRYALDIDNVLLPDGGDASIIGGNIFPGARPAIAGIHQHAGGGLKLIGIKFNGQAPNVFDYAYFGDDINGTIDLDVTGGGAENYKRSAFRLTSTTGFSQFHISNFHIASASSSPEADIYLDGISDVGIMNVGFVSGGTKQTAVSVNNGSNVRLSNTYHGYTTPETSNNSTNVKTAVWADVTATGAISDLTPPVVTSAIAATSNTIVVAFSEAVTTTSTGWTFKKNRVNNPIVSMSGSGNSRTFTVTNTMASGDTILRSYNSATGNASDLSSNLLASFTDAAVTNTIGGGGGGGVTIIDDQFNMANGTLLSAWTPAPINVPSASWTAPSSFSGFGQRVQVSGTGAVLVATLDAGIHDGTASVVINPSSNPTSDIGFIFRYTDANNYFLVDYSGFAGTFTLYENVGGTLNSRGTLTKAMAANTNYTLSVNLSGSIITASVDPQIDNSNTIVYTSTNNQTATKFGFWQAGGVSYYDNLLIKN